MQTPALGGRCGDLGDDSELGGRILPLRTQPRKHRHTRIREREVLRMLVNSSPEMRRSWEVLYKAVRCEREREQRERV